MGRESFSTRDYPHGRRVDRKRLPTPLADPVSSAFSNPPKTTQGLTKRTRPVDLARQVAVSWQGQLVGQVGRAGTLDKSY